MLVSMPMAITVKAVLVANKREAEAEEDSGKINRFPIEKAM